MTEAPAGRVLLNERARIAVRELISGTALAQINAMWEDEGFAPPLQDPEPVGGQRVTRFQGFLDQVDWTDPGQVARALRVFEDALRWLFDPPTDPTREPQPSWPSTRERIRRLFARDGYQIDDDGRITGGQTVALDERLLVRIENPDAVHEHLVRIERAVGNDDPAQVIGSAKELVESTAKVVLRALNDPVPDRADIPDLVRLVHQRLRIHPEDVPIDGPDGSRSIKKILGATTTIPAGIAELRNAGYGTGHGQELVRRGLGTRHARLAFTAARTWCEFVLDTLTDDRAPWQRQATEQPSPGQ
jgi:hypothetical protein